MNTQTQDQQQEMGTTELVAFLRKCISLVSAEKHLTNLTVVTACNILAEEARVQMSRAYIKQLMDEQNDSQQTGS